MHLFRRSNSGKSFFLQRETNSKDNAIFFFMNTEIASNIEALKFRATHKQSFGQPKTTRLNANARLHQFSKFV